MALQSCDACPGRCIPHARGPVQGRREDQPPIWTEASRKDLVPVAVKHCLVGRRLPVPHSHLLVHGCRNDLFPIRVEGGRPDRPLVSFEQCQGRAHAHVPEARRSVIGRRHDPADIVASHRPSALNEAFLTMLLPSRTTLALPVRASHRRAVPSMDAVTIRCPSGLKEAEKTTSVWPFNAFNSSPVVAFHSRAVLSYDAVTICCASGLKAAELTMEQWPINTERKRPQQTACFESALP